MLLFAKKPTIRDRKYVLDKQRLKQNDFGYTCPSFWKTLSSKFLAAKKAIKIIPMVVDDKAQPYLAWSNLFSTQAEESDPKR